MIKRSQAVRISQMSFAEDLKEELEAYQDSPGSPESFETSFVHSDVDSSDPTDFTERFQSLVEQFKRQSLIHFSAMQKACQSDQLMALASQRKRTTAQLEAKQDHIDRLENDLAKAMATIRSLQSQNTKLTQCVCKHMRLHNARRWFGLWTAFHARQKQAKQQLGRTLTRRYLKTGFGQWKSRARVLQPVTSPPKLVQEWAKPTGLFRLLPTKPEGGSFNLENFQPRTKRSLACKDR